MAALQHQCRMCGETGESTEHGISLLDPAYRSLADRIVSIFRYKIHSNNGFPTRICDTCISNLKQFGLFSEQCQQAQLKFKNQIETKLKTQNDDAAKVPQDLPITANNASSELTKARIPVVRQTDNNNVKKPSQLSVKKSCINRKDNFQCKLCFNKFTTTRSFKGHLRKSHRLSKEDVWKHVPENKCKYCEKTFKNVSQLEMHIGSHTLPFECELCGKRYPNKRAINLHIKSTHGEPDLPCSYCNKKFKQNSNLKRHIATWHTKSKEIFKCDVCNMVSKDKYILNDHKKRMHSENSSKKKWKCDECGKYYAESVTLRNHKKQIHEGGNVHPCQFCNKILKRADYLKIHIQTQHSDVRSFKCEQCDMAFKTSYILKNHVKRVHKDVKPTWKCFECGNIYRFRNDLRKHAIYAHNSIQFICADCNKNFKTKIQLLMHIKRRHMKRSRNLKCDQCDSKFFEQPALNTHKLLVHSDQTDYPYQCDKCKKTFKFQRYLDGHVRDMHSGHKHVCKICGLKFKRSDYLKYHIEKEHDNILRTYECKICKRVFTQRSMLLSHEQKTHKIHANYKCKTCFLVFRLEGNFKKHILSTGHKQ